MNSQMNEIEDISCKMTIGRESSAPTIKIKKI